MPDLGEVHLLMHVDAGRTADATVYARGVPAVTSARAVAAHEVLVQVVAPYEGQLASVVERVRFAPGLRALRVRVQPRS